MPITSTKNFRLSSGFGVSNSMWPRWARSKIGSGVIRISPLELTQRPRQIVEQLVHREFAGDEPLLRRVSNDHLQRAAHFFGAEPRRCGGRTGRTLLQQAENF